MEQALYQRRKLHDQLAASYGAELKDLRTNLSELLSKVTEKPHAAIAEITEVYAMQSADQATKWVKTNTTADEKTVANIVDLVAEYHLAERQKFDAQAAASETHQRLQSQQRRRHRQN